MKKDSSLSAAAYDEIKRRILSLELMPGDIVSDFSLSQQIDMSRTPIREAIMRLCNDGLLVEKNKRGYEVRRISAEDVIDLFDARDGIERTALEIAMERGVSDEVLDTLICINEKILASSRAADYDSVFDYDSDFHSYIIQASGNKRLQEYYASILLQLRRMRLMTYFRKDLPDAAYESHLMMVECIRKGKHKEAIDILHDHIIGTRDDYILIIKENIKSDRDFAVLRYLMTHNLVVESNEKKKA